MPLFFIWPILEARTEILQNFSFAFLEIWNQEKLLLRLTGFYYTEYNNRLVCVQVNFFFNHPLYISAYIRFFSLYSLYRARIPVASQVTALEIWLLACILLVFGALAEYAFILRQVINLTRKQRRLRERHV